MSVSRKSTPAAVGDGLVIKGLAPEQPIAEEAIGPVEMYWKVDQAGGSHATVDISVDPPDPSH